MALTGGATSAACILVLLALASAAGAATPAPAPAVDCTAAFAGLADCIDYVTPDTKSSRPSKTCCGEVKTAVNSPSTVDCLCSAMAAKTSPIPINMTRVLALPTACGESPTVFSKCKVVPGGAGAPMSAPAPASGGAIASPPRTNAAARPAVSATVLVVAATVAAPLFAFYYL
ncbi:hypothetical protein QYE76_067582 [Lolium multiflorum]|uniref:Bifunctional inhibitor/plant lipid transfer protein/seed storage helical domain-containing protein n=1 Tax=Lolium multiflorum TaxID=4521 RepID=A0AAD8SCV5_LOLMU|nr:hypothetical protein QYE76_067582 [Lolium multiflorum]